MKPGDKVKVSQTAPFHAGREGILDFLGEGKSEGTAVVLDPQQSTERTRIVFAVAFEHLIPLH